VAGVAAPLPVGELTGALIAARLGAGDEAIERFRAHPDGVDLLILDMIMPKRNGLEAHAAIERLRPGTKTLFVSGYGNDLLDLDQMRGGGGHFIAKPVTPPVLLDKVREILESR
jgi:CheY-like chemotaxis protein